MSDIRDQKFDLKFDLAKALASDNIIWEAHAREQYDRAEKAEALAASRLKLLRRENTIRFSRGKQCFFCDRYPILNHKIGSDYEKVYIDNHADDCEWAEELGDE